MAEYASPVLSLALWLSDILQISITCRIVENWVLYFWGGPQGGQLPKKKIFARLCTVKEIWKIIFPQYDKPLDQGIICRGGQDVTMKLAA